jgi:RimJ/RimL family protein N-acetyltransferase
MSESPLPHWSARPRPRRVVLSGRFVRLEPVVASAHGEGLFLASTGGDAAERFRWLPEVPPVSREAFAPWLEMAENCGDPLYFAILDRRDGHDGEVVGRQTLMRIDAANGVIEVGNILWSAAMARSPLASEALFLFARHVFDDLGYRRFEWKCNAANEPSRRAALRFGFRFEGIFRKHMVVKGRNRDTAWFAMTDDDWPAARAAFEAWLAPENFDAGGRQKRRLADIRAGLEAG